LELNADNLGHFEILVSSNYSGGMLDRNFRLEVSVSECQGVKREA
jgi:hypothetical protein